MIRNLTPHAITVVDSNGNPLETFLPAGPPARVHEHHNPLPWVDGWPLSEVLLGGVYDLPHPEPGVWLIVSRMVAEAVPERGDLLLVSQTVRDHEGRIIGCRGFATLFASGVEAHALKGARR